MWFNIIFVNNKYMVHWLFTLFTFKLSTGILVVDTPVDIGGHNVLPRTLQDNVGLGLPVMRQMMVAFWSPTLVD